MLSTPVVVAVLAVVALLGLVGTPPTIVFVGKLTTTAAAWDAGHAWLAVAVFVNTVASLFYYLRWIAPVYGHGHRDGSEDAEASHDPALTTARIFSASAAVVTAALSVGLGLGAGLLWRVIA